MQTPTKTANTYAENKMQNEMQNLMDNEIMPKTWIRFSKPSARRCAAAVASAIVALQLAGLAQPSLARQAAPKTFSTAEEASQALYLAVQNKDEKALAAILGAGKELVSSNDRVQDRRDRARFIEKYREMHRLAHEPGAATVLYIGAENWPFPIPLASENGAWHFDAKTGMQEVLFRRIGENELSASQACHALVLARKEHTWQQRDTSMQPLRALPGQAAGVAFHGYQFRNLVGNAKDGSAIVAYPAVYGSTGVMTYVVDRNDVVYAKDLGPNTGSIAKGMTRLEPDPTWHPDE